MAKFKINAKSELFKALINENPIWWQNLKSEPDVYIDVRMDNYINVYYKGGSIVRLSYSNGFIGEVSSEYVPLESDKPVISYTFDPAAVSFSAKQIQVAKINQFSKPWLKKVKKRIGLFNPQESEKAIQGDYVVKKGNCFIDTELQINKHARIDLVWIDVEKQRLFFVELKTIGDSRIYFDETVKANAEKIDEQMKKYHGFLSAHKSELADHYAKLIEIKDTLGVLPKQYKGPVSLPKLEIEARPILLVGDCTKKWILDNHGDINKRINAYALAAIYHGRSTNTFRVPVKTRNNEYVF